MPSDPEVMSSLDVESDLKAGPSNVKITEKHISKNDQRMADSSDELSSKYPDENFTCTVGIQIADI